jgi:hypothetical protein
MTTKKIIKGMAALALIASLSCNKHSHEEEELITTLKFIVLDNSNSVETTYTFSDPDGAGGNSPTKFDTIKLKANTSYSLAVKVLNESVSPAEDLTSEITAEANDHQFYYLPSSGLNLTIESLNKDGNNLPVGLNGSFKTLASSNGNLQVILKHKPGNKKASDDATVGETDIELPNGGFYVQIQ